MSTPPTKLFKKSQKDEEETPTSVSSDSHPSPRMVVMKMETMGESAAEQEIVVSTGKKGT